MEQLRIGGAPVVTLCDEAAPTASPAFVEATVLPGRGMMLLQARLRLPSGAEVDGLFAPSLAEAASEMDGRLEDFAGNRSFAYGGALLVPFANRIRGRAREGAREIDAVVDGARARLPRNWGGKAPGAEQYSMHGLILDAAVPFQQPSPGVVRGRLLAGDFGGRWPSRTELAFEWRLAAGALTLTVEARNVGDQPLPMGIGWHPYLAISSGDRRQARLRLPARLRAEVNNYDEVLPTGHLSDVAGGPYDFDRANGTALCDLYLDDCFTGLRREGGAVAVEVIDPAADVGLRVTSNSPEIHAVQVYAPPEKAFVVVEPQYNLADPYSPLWPDGTRTGMARIPPGEAVTYEARLEAFPLRNRPST